MSGDIELSKKGMEILTKILSEAHTRNKYVSIKLVEALNFWTWPLRQYVLSKLVSDDEKIYSKKLDRIGLCQ